MLEKSTRKTLMGSAYRKDVYYNKSSPTEQPNKRDAGRNRRKTQNRLTTPQLEDNSQLFGLHKCYENFWKKFVSQFQHTKIQ